MTKKFGNDWIKHVKISSNRISKWKERRTIEEKRLKGVALESRLIYYSDFYDLKSIIDKHWDDGLMVVFQDKKSVSLFLEEIEKFRDPNAHRRELFEYQKYLIKGISGEIRTRIMKYRGKKEDPNDYFPVIEAVNDSLGNCAENTRYAQIIQSKQLVKVGNTIEIIGYSTDPLGDVLEYSIARIGHTNWSKSNRGIISFMQSDIGKCCDIQIKVRSKRDYHAYGNFDDYVQFRYVVIPE